MAGLTTTSNDAYSLLLQRVGLECQMLGLKRGVSGEKEGSPHIMWILSLEELRLPTLTHVKSEAGPRKKQSSLLLSR